MKKNIMKIIFYIFLISKLKTIRDLLLYDYQALSPIH